MTDDAKSIKALKRFYKSWDTADNETFFEHLDGESDRSAVILMSTGLEDGLLVRLLLRMRGFEDENEFARMFENNGPLASFSFRIEVAYQFKIIDKRARESLHIVRELRNACAHSRHPISFETAEVIAVCRRLLKPRGYGTIRDETRQSVRGAFLSEVIALNLCVREGRGKANAAIRRIFREAPVVEDQT